MSITIFLNFIKTECFVLPQITEKLQQIQGLFNITPQIQRVSSLYEPCKIKCLNTVFILHIATYIQYYKSYTSNRS